MSIIRYSTNISSAEFVFLKSKDNSKITETERNLLIDLYRSYGDIEARNKVIESVYRFIWKFAFKYSKPDNSFEPDDLFQLGILSAIKAIDTFEPDKSKFLTYFSQIYLNDIRMLYRKLIHNDSILSLDAIIFEGKDGSEITIRDTICDDKAAEELYQIEDSDELREFLEIFEDIYKNDLNDSQRSCIDQRFGLHGKKCYRTHDEYAKEVNVSRANISRIYNTAIRKIANGFQNRKLTHFNTSNVVTTLTSIRTKSIPVIVGLDEKFPKLDSTDSYIVRALYGYNGSTPQRIRSLIYLLGYTKYTILNRLNYIASDEFTGSDGLERCKSKLDDILERLDVLNPREQKIIKAIYGVDTEQVYSMEDFKTGKPIEGISDPPKVPTINLIFAKMGLNERIYYDNDSIEKEILDRYFGMNGYERQSVGDICKSTNLSYYMVNSFLEKSTNMNDKVIPEVIKDNAETQFLREIYPHVDILLQTIIDQMLKENESYHFPATQIAAKFDTSDQIIRRKRRELLEWVKDPDSYHRYIENFNHYKAISEKIYDDCSDIMKEFLDRLFGLHGHSLENATTIHYWIKSKYGKGCRDPFSIITSQLSKIEYLLSHYTHESFEELFRVNHSNKITVKIRNMYFGLNGSVYHIIPEISAITGKDANYISGAISNAYTTINNKAAKEASSKPKKTKINKENVTKTSRVYKRKSEEIKHVLEIYNTLPTEWKTIVDLYYGLHNKEATSITDIATILGYCRARIYNILNNIRNNEIPKYKNNRYYDGKEAFKLKAVEIYDSLSSTWKRLADVYFGLHGEVEAKKQYEVVERTGISLSSLHNFIKYLKDNDGKTPPSTRRGRKKKIDKETTEKGTTKETVLLERDIIENRYEALDISDQVVIDCLYGMNGRKKMTLEEMCKTFNLGPRKMKKRIQAIFDFILHDYNMNSN